MTTTERDVAWVAAGMLAASGELSADLTVEAATERLASALEPQGRAVPWAPPDEVVVAQVGDTLVRAWAGVPRPAGEWDDAVVRLRVWDLESLGALGAVAVPGWQVTAHASFRGYRIAWRWPLRVAVATAALAEQVGGDFLHVHVLHGGGADGGGADGGGADGGGADGGLRSFEVVVLDAGFIEAGGDALVGLRAACVVLPGVSAGDLESGLLDRLRPFEAGAVVAVAGADVSWLATAARHLACGRPLDVAVALAEPSAVVLAVDGFLELTTAREYAWALTGQLQGADPAVAGEALAALERLVEAPFDADGRAGAELAAVVESVSAAGLGDLTTVEHHLHMASAMPDDEMSADGGDGTAESFEIGAEAPEDTADDRRLQAQVVDPTTRRVLQHGFLGGAVNQVKVRIAAGVEAGVVVGDAVFASPTPGEDVDLTVEVIAGGAHARRKLRLPAAGDSKWTKAVPVAIPGDVKSFEVFVQVWFAGRVVQSATLSGPVVVAAPEATVAAADGGPPPAGTLRLSVDASTPAAAVHRMTPADGSITIVPGLTGKPVALRFGQDQPVESDRLEKANDGVRAVLNDTFNKPAPASLAEAARPLTRLAVRGRLLRDALLESLGELPGDDARWIQVSGFGSADLPLELLYTHPMPADDKEVPVCPSALAGATECVRSCPDRDRDDVVCPYGFWGTSKVVERRRHIDQRTRRRAGSERTITILAAGAAGVASQADKVDSRASTRIRDAVEAAVTAGRFHPLPEWAALRKAVEAPATVLVLITHTVEGEDDLGPELQIGSSTLGAHRVGVDGFLNPGQLEPGPVVVAIGCDTADLDTSFTSYVTNLHRGGAELVVSAISPVPGRRVADFVERLFAAIPGYLEGDGVHRFGEVLTAIRRQTIATGDILGLALTASGDGDVAIAKG